jgi:nitrogen fixation/metabolism regulation signal transduction histidine kinase
MSKNDVHPQAGLLESLADIVRQLTHESRNALQRSQAALERLRWQLGDRHEALLLLARAQRAQEEMVCLCEAAHDLTTPNMLQRTDCDLGQIWRDVCSRMAGPANRIQLAENIEAIDLHCEGDRARLAQVLRHLLNSMTTIGSEPISLTVAAEPFVLAGRPALQLTFRHTAAELTAEQRTHLFAPFTADRPRYHQLGLAAARKIVEAHGGQLLLGPGPGLQLVLQLPRSSS